MRRTIKVNNEVLHKMKTYPIEDVWNMVYDLQEKSISLIKNKELKKVK